MDGAFELITALLDSRAVSRVELEHRSGAVEAVGGLVVLLRAACAELELEFALRGVPDARSCVAVAVADRAEQLGQLTIEQRGLTEPAAGEKVTIVKEIERDEHGRISRIVEKPPQ